jgi:hypothetical protein
MPDGKMLKADTYDAVGGSAARNLLTVTAWVDGDFLVIADPAKKSRKYGMASEFAEIVR